MKADHHSNTTSSLSRAPWEAGSGIRCIGSSFAAKFCFVPGEAQAPILQVGAGGRVTLQLGVGVPRSAEDEVEELRAELDRMEHGGEDADEAHMYARSSSCALQTEPPAACCVPPFSCSLHQG